MKKFKPFAVGAIGDSIGIGLGSAVGAADYGFRHNNDHGDLGARRGYAAVSKSPSMFASVSKAYRNNPLNVTETGKVQRQGNGLPDSDPSGIRFSFTPRSHQISRYC